MKIKLFERTGYHCAHIFAVLDHLENSTYVDVQILNIAPTGAGHQTTEIFLFLESPEYQAIIRAIYSDFGGNTNIVTAQIAIQNVFDDEYTDLSECSEDQIKQIKKIAIYRAKPTITPFIYGGDDRHRELKDASDLVKVYEYYHACSIEQIDSIVRTVLFQERLGIIGRRLGIRPKAKKIKEEIEIEIDPE